MLICFSTQEHGLERFTSAVEAAGVSRAANLAEKADSWFYVKVIKEFLRAICACCKTIYLLCSSLLVVVASSAFLNHERIF
jgi:tRNA U34 5-carboxymethylaminomethyl modifying GTPase MnmE/TrmE